MGYSFSVTIHGALLSFSCLLSITRIPLEHIVVALRSSGKVTFMLLLRTVPTNKEVFLFGL